MATWNCIKFIVKILSSLLCLQLSRSAQTVIHYYYAPVYLRSSGRSCLVDAMLEALLHRIPVVIHGVWKYFQLFNLSVMFLLVPVKWFNYPVPWLTRGISGQDKSTQMAQNSPESTLFAPHRVPPEHHPNNTKSSIRQRTELNVHLPSVCWIPLEWQRDPTWGKLCKV